MFRPLRGHKESTTRPLSRFESVFCNPCLVSPVAAAQLIASSHDAISCLGEVFSRSVALWHDRVMRRNVRLVVPRSLPFTVTARLYIVRLIPFSVAGIWDLFFRNWFAFLQ